jgi:hypothetical protein
MFVDWQWIFMVTEIFIDDVFYYLKKYTKFW